MNGAIRAILSLILLVTTAGNIQAKKIDFIDADVNKFIERFVPKGQKVGFSKYYKQLNEKMKEASTEKKDATYGYLYDLALNALEAEGGDRYAAISPYVKDARFTLDSKFNDARKVIKMFLTRYGAYKEYSRLREKMRDGFKNPKLSLAKMKQENDSNDMWGSMKGYAHKVGSWFGMNTITA